MRCPNSASHTWICPRRPTASGAPFKMPRPRARPDRASEQMTQAAEILVPARASEDKLIAGVCIAHFVSHYYMLLLAPLFVFIKDEYGVTYTELSLALAAFGVVSSVMQTPVGFFVDRFGARLNLIGGLLLGSAAVAAAGPVDFVWVFIASLAGIGVSKP